MDFGFHVLDSGLPDLLRLTPGTNSTHILFQTNSTLILFVYFISDGTVKDACGCCDVCARGEGESCGGLFYNHGKCGNGLNCVRRRPNSVKVLGENDLVSGVCEKGTYFLSLSFITFKLGLYEIRNSWILHA